VTDWLIGTPMDPTAQTTDPLPTLAGLPFAHAGAGIVIVGPTGSGRSNLVEVGFYDASAAGLRCAYLGSEIPEPEFNARAAAIAEVRGDTIDDELIDRLKVVRYLSLAETIVRANLDPKTWREAVSALYDVVAIDPLSAVASALGYDFDKSNQDFVKFYDTLVQPVTDQDVTFILLDNIGHALEAQSRAKGASAKQDRADLTFACSKAPAGLLIKAQKVRSIRAGVKHGDQWLFDRNELTITPHNAAEPLVGSRSPAFRPTVLMQRVSELVEAQPGLGKKAIRDGVSGRNNYVDEATRTLIAEGYIEQRLDSRGGHHHYPIRPFNAESDGGPCPDRAHFTVPTLPTLPHSVPDLAHVPAEDRAPRAIQTESVGHGARSGHVQNVSNDNDAPELVLDDDPTRRLERLRRYDEIGREVFAELLDVDPAVIPDLPIQTLLGVLE